MSFDWMKKSVGISFHWTSHSVCVDGTHLPYQESVDKFDVDRFVSDIVKSGAEHCMITLTHAEQYLAFPCEPLDKLLPGRTTKRDLIGEIADRLTAAGVRFMVYYNHSCNGPDDPVWKDACGYSAGQSGDLDAFAKNILDIVSYISKRYGEKLSAWWFDSSYSVDPKGPHNTITCDMGDWQFPWEGLYRAAKAGNENSAVCFNAGISSNFLYSPYQDYYAGETVDIHEEFTPAEVPGMIGHRWTTIENLDWAYHAGSAKKGFADPRFPLDEVTAFVADNLAKGRMTTFNMEVDQVGVINPKSLEQFSKIIAAVK